MSDFNIALVIVAIIVCVVALLVSVYFLVNFQHPEDKNQAYFPKCVVILGLTVAQLATLMLPADVANRHSCQHSVFSGACSFTLPMKSLWYSVWVATAVLIFLVIPFAMFFYEADQERSRGKRIKSALVYCGLTAVVVGLVLGITYVYPTYFFSFFSSPQILSFFFLSLASDVARCPQNLTTPGRGSWRLPICAVYRNVARPKCSAFTVGGGSVLTWTQRVSLPMYVIALTTIVGSILFTVYGGVGIAVLPLEALAAYVARPKAIITRSQYIKVPPHHGRRIAQQAWLKQPWSFCPSLRPKKHPRELLILEEDESALEEVYPQGEEADASWALTVLSYLGKLLFGVIGLAVSVLWVLHILVYVVVRPPASTFLNQVFIQLDKAWGECAGLLGTAAFGFFCFYLLLAVMAGEMYMGANFFIFTLHPMKYFSSRTSNPKHFHPPLLRHTFFCNPPFSLCILSVIQFCAKAFANYVEATAVAEIFGHTLENLRGIRVLYKLVFNMFQIAFVILAILTLIYFVVVGFKKHKKWRKRSKVVVLS
eukprot:jgi/Mesen1/5584/ME000281S04639